MIAPTRRFALTSLLAAVTAIAAGPAGAQQASAPAIGLAQQRLAPAGPTIDRAAVGARVVSQQPASLDDADAAMQQRVGLGQSRALMIVGFGAMLVGLLIGDDVGTVIAIGGAAVGLYGLYHYLK